MEHVSVGWATSSGHPTQCRYSTSFEGPMSKTSVEWTARTTPALRDRSKHWPAASTQPGSDCLPGVRMTTLHSAGRTLECLRVLDSASPELNKESPLLLLHCVCLLCLVAAETTHVPAEIPATLQSLFLPKFSLRNWQLSIQLKRIWPSLSCRVCNKRHDL